MRAPPEAVACLMDACRTARRIAREELPHARRLLREKVERLRAARDAEGALLARNGVK